MFNLAKLRTIRALRLPRPVESLRLADWPTDEEVIAAIKSVPMHYADLVITATAVQPVFNNCTVQPGLILGANLTAGQLVYADQTTTSPVGQLKATLAGGTSAQQSLLGILLVTGNSGQAAEIATAGQVTFNAVLTQGKEYFMSVNAGFIADAPPTTGNLIVRIGFGKSPTVMQLDFRVLAVAP